MTPDRSPPNLPHPVPARGPRSPEYTRRAWIVALVVLVAIAGEAYGFLGLGSESAPSGMSSYTASQGLCGGRTVAVSLSAVHSKSLLVSSSSAGVGSFLVFLTVDSTGQACDRYGDYAAVRHTVANLTVRDLTHPFNGTDLWFAGLDVQIGPSSANDGSTASAPTRAEASHLGPGDALTLGFVDVDWRPGVAAHLNVTFSETVFADPSLLHVGDTLRFTANVQFIVDNSACFGACWSPFFDEAFNRTLSFEVQASAS